MSEDVVSTVVETEIDTLPFQQYFVKHRCEPVVREIWFEGAEQARPTAEVLAALADPLLEAVILAPSNPYLSIDPIFAVPGFGKAMRAAGVPIVAVSPIVGGEGGEGANRKTDGRTGC